MLKRIIDTRISNQNQRVFVFRRVLEHKKFFNLTVQFLLDTSSCLRNSDAKLVLYIA